MAKSKIIKDLANGTIDTATALKRTKVLLSELNDSQLLHWVNCELTGYSDDEELPDYRVVYGQLMGSYFKGSMTRYMQWTNVSLPLGNMPEELQEALLSIRLSEGSVPCKIYLSSMKATIVILERQFPQICFRILQNGTMT